MVSWVRFALQRFSFLCCAVRGWEVTLLRPEYHSLFLAAVYLDDQRYIETDVADMFCLLDGRQLVEYVLPVDAIASESIDGEIADSERGEVLEEVRALRRVDLEFVYAGFHNDLCCTDMTPPYGNAEPWVAAAPTAGTDEHIGGSLLGVFSQRRILRLCVLSVCWGVVGVLCQEGSVYLLNFLSNGRGVGSCKSFRLDIDNIAYLIEDAVPDGTV